MFSNFSIIPLTKGGKKTSFTDSVSSLPFATSTIKITKWFSGQALLLFVLQFNITQIKYF